MSTNPSKWVGDTLRRMGGQGVRQRVGQGVGQWAAAGVGAMGGIVYSEIR